MEQVRKKSGASSLHSLLSGDRQAPSRSE